MSQPSARTYIDPESLFTLQVPPGWLVDTSGQQGALVILLHPNIADDFRANVNVTVQDIQALTRDEYLTLTRLQLKQLTGRPTADVDEPAGLPPGGHLLEWSAPFGPLTLTARQLIVFQEPRAFVVTATAPAATFNAYRPDLQAVLDSFQLHSPDPV